MGPFVNNRVRCNVVLISDYPPVSRVISVRARSIPRGVTRATASFEWVLFDKDAAKMGQQ